jgi:hypothetical protein
MIIQSFVSGNRESCSLQLQAVSTVNPPVAGKDATIMKGENKNGSVQFQRNRNKESKQSL